MTAKKSIPTLIEVSLFFLFLTLLCPSFLPGAQEGQYPVLEDVPMPKTLILCNEAVPLESRWVWELLDRELTIAAWDRAQVFMWLKRAGRYFPHIERELARAGMPDDLKYLAVAESSLITHIRSKKGAMGPWQFMPHTARRNGLRKDRSMDERRDFERSTEAALGYLRRLKETFGTWTLAMAAYNCGEARMEREIEEQRVRDYYRLNLPAETERYVFRIAAIKIILEDPERYGYRISKERVYKPVKSDKIRVKIRVPLHLADVAHAVGTDVKEFKDLNPQIIGYFLPEGRYSINTPSELGSRTSRAIRELSRTASPPKAKFKKRYYVVQPGDTLSHISTRTGVSVATLKRLNSLDGSLIMVGQKLRLKP